MAMKIETGLLKSMVMPRNAENVSEQLVAGTCKAKALACIDAKIYSSGKKTPLLSLPNCGTAKNGKFSAQMNGIPVGGPYTVELTIGNSNEKCVVDDVLVGDVWILAGQSNMQGHGIITGKHLNKEDKIRAYFMDCRWGVAQEPVCNISISPYEAHRKLLSRVKPRKTHGKEIPRGAGPGLPFAMQRFATTGVPQGLIACAHGGTEIAQWDPKLKNEGTGSLYGAMLYRIALNGGRVSGLLWYQGCNDSASGKYKQFQQRTLDFFRGLRRDLHAPNLPIVQVQLSRAVSPGADGDVAYSALREAQRNMPRKIKHLLTVPAIDATLDDVIHLDEESQFKVGHRLAEAMQTLLNEPGALPPPIELQRIKLEFDRVHTIYTTRIYYKNVVGKLQCFGIPMGFSYGPDGKIPIFKTSLDENCVVLRSTQEPLSVAYGYGANPYCNITDAAGRSLPTTDYIPVPKPFANTGFGKHVEISEPILGKIKVRDVKYEQSKSLKYMPASNSAQFNIIPYLEQYKECDGICFFRTKYQAKNDVAFALSLGYDGNVKVFVDGKQVYLDEEAVNPILPCSYLVRQKWTKGTHEVVIAIEMGYGSVWGISITTEGTPKQLEQLPVEI